MGPRLRVIYHTSQWWPAPPSFLKCLINLRLSCHLSNTSRTVSAHQHNWWSETFYKQVTGWEMGHDSRELEWRDGFQNGCHSVMPFMMESFPEQFFVFFKYYIHTCLTLTFTQSIISLKGHKKMSCSALYLVSECESELREAETGYAAMC